jgi:hypothetical protein
VVKSKSESVGVKAESVGVKSDSSGKSDHILARICVDETREVTVGGKLNDGISGEVAVRRGVSSRLLDDRSTLVDLVSKPHLACLPFSGSSLDGSHSVLDHALYLKSSVMDPGVSLPTIF